MAEESFYVTTTPGLEFISAREIEKLGGRIEEIRRGRGRIFLRGDLELMVRLNYLSRTLERVMILLTFDEFENLDDIYKIVKNLSFDFIKPDQSFAVRPLRVGQHEFTSLDVGRVVGQAIIDSYLESRGVRLRVNLDNPDVIIRADVIFNELYVGLDTTGDAALHKRGYRVYDHPAPLNPTIASSLVMISSWNVEKSLLDPMCGSGTILIESAMIGRDIPPQKLRKEFQFLRIYNGDMLRDLIESSSERDVKMKLLGIEKFRKHLRGAVLNSKKAGVYDTIDFVQGDATRMCVKDVDVMITNPPYGMRIARKGIIENLYRGFLKCSKDITDEIIVITAEHKILREKALDIGYSIRDEIKVKYGGLDAVIFILKS